MKKVLSVLLCVFLLFCLMGCSQEQEIAEEDVYVEEEVSSADTDVTKETEETEDLSRFIVSAEILLEDFNQEKGDHFFDFSDSPNTYYENLYLTYNDGSMETYSFMFDDIYGTDVNEMGVVYRGTIALVRDASFVGGGCFYLLDTQTNSCEFVCYGTDVDVKDDLVYITMGSMDESPDEITVFNMKTGQIEDVYYE